MHRYIHTTVKSFIQDSKIIQAIINRLSKNITDNILHVLVEYTLVLIKRLSVNIVTLFCFSSLIRLVEANTCVVLDMAGARLTFLLVIVIAIIVAHEAGNSNTLISVIEIRYNSQQIQSKFGSICAINNTIGFPMYTLDNPLYI